MEGTNLSHTIAAYFFFLPMFSHVAMWGYGAAIGFAVLILVGLFVVVRTVSGDPDAHSDLRQMVEALGGGAGGGQEAASSGRKSSDGHLQEEPFEDTCPACSEPVTHEHGNCPACGLRLLG
jgi:hypothetical protein